MKKNITIFKKRLTLLFITSLSSLFFIACSPGRNIENSINTQTQRVSSELKRHEYTVLGDTRFTVEHGRKYKRKKYNIDQLKVAAMNAAEKDAIFKGADGILNPRFVVEERGRFKKGYKVTVAAKSYRLKDDSEYIDMENQLKHNPNSER